MPSSAPFLSLEVITVSVFNSSGSCLQNSKFHVYKVLKVLNLDKIYCLFNTKDENIEHLHSLLASRV